MPPLPGGLRVGGTSGGPGVLPSNQTELAKHHTPPSALSRGRQRRGGADGCYPPPPFAKSPPLAPSCPGRPSRPDVQHQMMAPALEPKSSSEWREEQMQLLQPDATNTLKALNTFSTVGDGGGSTSGSIFWGSEPEPGNSQAAILRTGSELVTSPVGGAANNGPKLASASL